MFERHGIVTIELGPSAQREARRAKSDARANRDSSAKPTGEVAIAVTIAARRAEAVDAGAALPTYCSDKSGTAR